MNQENARAIAVGFEAGKASEQERIVNLLSSIAWTSIAKTDDESRMVSTRDLIALIRGDVDE
jgi:hypothetical protein